MKKARSYLLLFISVIALSIPVIAQVTNEEEAYDIGIVNIICDRPQKLWGVCFRPITVFGTTVDCEWTGCTNDYCG